MFVHAALGRVGQEDPDLPLVIDRRGESIAVRDQEYGTFDVHIYTEKDFHTRTPFDPKVMAVLGEKRVLVVGEGSVGSVLTEALAQAGVGHIAGTDPDVLEVHNCMRHQLGTEFVGWNKASALQHRLETAGPTCRFTPIPIDLFSGNRQELREFLAGYKPHAIVGCADSNSVQNLAQMAASHIGAVFCAVGCFGNAIEGEMFIRLSNNPLDGTGDTVGYACYEDLHPPGAGERVASQYDYSSDVPGRYAGEPALGHLIKHKVFIAATILVDVLLYGESVKTKTAEATDRHLVRGAQYVRIGGPYVTDGIKAMSLDRPWQVKWGRIKRHADCSICGDGVDVASVLFPCYDEVTELDTEW